MNGADALLEVAERSLAGGKSTRPAGERHQVVIHADAASLPSPARGSCRELRTGNRAAGVEPRPGALLALGRGERFDRELAVAGLLARAVRAGP